MDAFLPAIRVSTISMDAHLTLATIRVTSMDARVGMIETLRVSMDAQRGRSDGRAQSMDAAPAVILSREDGEASQNARSLSCWGSSVAGRSAE
jgi:hypothetical protein